MLDVKDAPGFKRDLNGSLISTDPSAYDQYMLQYNAKIQREKEINSKIESLESELTDIKGMLTELLSRVSK